MSQTDFIRRAVPFFRISKGRLRDSSETTFPAVTADRLALVAASGFTAFRPVFDALTAMFRGFSLLPDEPVQAEAPRNAKGWMREHMLGGTYSEILDQPAFTARIDLQQALDNSRSFRKLYKEWQTHVSGRA